MTIVTNYLRETFPNEEFATAEEYCESAVWNDADVTARNRDIFIWSGQLWERIAEGRHHPQVITVEQFYRVGAIRNELGTQSILHGLTSIDDE